MMSNIGDLRRGHKDIRHEEVYFPSEFIRVSLFKGTPLPPSLSFRRAGKWLGKFLRNFHTDFLVCRNVNEGRSLVRLNLRTPLKWLGRNLFFCLHVLVSSSLKNISISKSLNISTSYFFNSVNRCFIASLSGFNYFF